MKVKDVLRILNNSVSEDGRIKPDDEFVHLSVGRNPVFDKPRYIANLQIKVNGAMIEMNVDIIDQE